MKLPKFNFFKKKTEKEKAVFYIKKLWALKKIRWLVLFFVILLLSPFALFFVIRPKLANHINYGVTFSHKYAKDLGLDWKEAYLATLDDLKVKKIRLVAYWDEIESENGVYNYDIIRWQVEEAKKRDAQVILTVGRKVPRYPECFQPKWWNETQNENIRDYELLEYVKNTVNEFKKYDNIFMWQVENEPLFPFGDCIHEIKWETVAKEVELVRSLDNRPILTQDSGEGGFWYPSYKLGDYLGISMYRKIWYDFWGAFFGNFIYFKYPLAHWSYKIKADLLQVPYQKIIVTELQAEPWGPGINSQLSQEEKDKTMSRHDFLETLTYAQKTGFADLYLWGVEWWYWEKEFNKNPYFWDVARVIFN